MKIRMIALALLGLAGSASGCMVSAPVIPPYALIQNYRAPLDIDNDQTQLGTKQGTASSQCVLGVASWGDASTHAAAQQGGLTTIRSADYEFYTVFGIYSKYTTVVHGD